MVCYSQAVVCHKCLFNSKSLQFTFLLPEKLDFNFLWPARSCHANSAWLCTELVLSYLEPHSLDQAKAANVNKPLTTLGYCSGKWTTGHSTAHIHYVECCSL